MSAIAQRLSQAAARHEQGDLQEAERLCRQVIQREPMQVEALNLLGVTPREMVSIFQALKQAGALQGELRII